MKARIWGSGEEEHFDNSWFEKAIINKREALENKPQSAVQQQYETQFKSRFNKLLEQGFDNIIESIENQNETTIKSASTATSQ